MIGLPSAALAALPRLHAVPPAAVLSVLVCVIVAVVLGQRRRRRSHHRPRDPVCGCPDWTMRRAEARGAEFAQRVLAALFEPMATQIGGMQHEDAKRGMMSLRQTVDDPARLLAKRQVPILKAMQSRRRGEREVSFYEAMTVGDARWGGAAKDPAAFAQAYGGLGEFLSAYHGVVKLAESEVRSRGSYIVINDATAGMRRPNVLDVKMGTVTYEPDMATAERKAREYAKYPEQADLGMRVVGMRCWRPEAQAFDVHDKTWGLSLRSHGALLQGFALFFGRDARDLRRRRPAIADFEQRCRRLLHWFHHTNDDLGFISSSLLFVYDADDGKADDDDDKAPGIELRMIDFTHVRRDGTKDLGYILGLTRLIEILAALQQDPPPKVIPASPLHECTARRTAGGTPR